LKEWTGKVTWESLLNKRGITWKKLDAAEQQNITSENAAFKLMQEKTSIIKRPVIETNDKVLLGFDEKAYEEQLLGK
jgi:arsenate reductase